MGTRPENTIAGVTHYQYSLEILIRYANKNWMYSTECNDDPNSKNVRGLTEAITHRSPQKVPIEEAFLCHPVIPEKHKQPVQFIRRKQIHK